VIQINLLDQLLVVYRSKIYNNVKITQQHLQLKLRHERPTPIYTGLSYNYLHI